MVRRIKAKLVPGLRDQGLSRNTIAWADGMYEAQRDQCVRRRDRSVSPTVVWRTKTDDEVYALLFPGRGAIESAHEQPDWRACTANWDVWASR